LPGIQETPLRERPRLAEQASLLLQIEIEQVTQGLEAKIPEGFVLVVA
jgi:hypothetical protein